MTIDYNQILTVAIGILGLVVPALVAYFLADIKELKKWQFRTVSPKERYETFSEIEKINETISKWKACKLKALYERIGMYFSPKMNEYILAYAREKRLKYNDETMSAFLKWSWRLDSGDGSLEWSAHDYKKTRWQRWGGGGLTFVVILGLAFSFLYMALHTKSDGVNKVLPYIFSAIMLIQFVFFVIIFAVDDTRHKLAWRFYNNFTPWLEEHKDIELQLQQEKEVSEQESDEIIYPDISDTTATPFKRIRRLLGK